MPRYHFDLVDSVTIANKGGVELSDDLKAIDAAEDVARSLVFQQPELRNRNFYILVSNQDGEEICRFPLDIVPKEARDSGS